MALHCELSGEKIGLTGAYLLHIFLEDTELRKQVNDETRSRQVSSLFSYYKTKYSNFYEKNPTPIHT